MNALQKINEVEKQARARGMGLTRLSVEAGMSDNYLSNRKTCFKKNPNTQLAKRSLRVFKKVDRVLSRHRVKYPEVLKGFMPQMELPLLAGNGQDKTSNSGAVHHARALPTIPVRGKAQATLMNLIGERLSAMSVVQLALFYAKIVGDEG